MWITTFCPNFACMSFVTILVSLQVILFIACGVYTRIIEKKDFNEVALFGPQLDTFIFFGMRIPYRIKNDLAIHRLILPSLLHYGFMPLCINIFVEMLIGYIVEAPLGSFRMFIFYLITVVGGNLFGSLFDFYSVGAEPFIYGCFAAIIAMFIVYWERLKATQSQKFCCLFLMVFLLVISLSFLQQVGKSMRMFSTIQTGGVQGVVYPDFPGSLGGFIFGLMGAMMLLPAEKGAGLFRGNKN